MRFLQLVMSVVRTGPPDPARMAKNRQAIQDKIARGETIATGGLGKRETTAARITRKDGAFTVEEGLTEDNWMAAGGYSLNEAATKEEAIENAKATLDVMGDGVLELIQVSEMYPPPNRLPQPTANPALPAMPLGVVPYLSIDGASEASAFYQRAFGAREVARMDSQDGKRLMHCQLEINGGALMFCDSFPEMGAPPIQRSESYVMQLIVPNGDEWWQRAIKAGCKEKLPFVVAPWGDKYGQLMDPYGVTWALSSPVVK